MSVTPVYGSGQVAALTLDVPLPRLRAYRLVLDNTFSVLTRKVVQLRAVRAICGG